MGRRPFKAVPLRNPPKRKRAGGSGGSRFRRDSGWSPIMVMLPLAAFTSVFLWGERTQTGAVELAAQAGEAELETRFSLCSGRGRLGGNCVVDGDTFWYAGEKIRIADINTPEVSDPGCALEAELGAAATARLQALLNQGAFTLESADRDRDRYGRALRVVTRDGESLGGMLVGEGLAEEWRGYRGSWC